MNFPSVGSNPFPVINRGRVYSNFQSNLSSDWPNSVLGNPLNLQSVSEVRAVCETVPSWDFAVWLTPVMTSPYSPPFPEFQTWPESQLDIVVLWEGQSWPLLCSDVFFHPFYQCRLHCYSLSQLLVPFCMVSLTIFSSLTSSRLRGGRRDKELPLNWHSLLLRCSKSQTWPPGTQGWLLATVSQTSNFSHSPLDMDLVAPEKVIRCWGMLAFLCINNFFYPFSASPEAV